MTNKTEDRFYFGKPGQPERFERRMTSQELGHLRNWISNHARNTDEAVSAMGKMQRIFEDDPEFWEDKGWSAVARAANVLAFSRPGQPERFGRLQTLNADLTELVKQRDRLLKDEKRIGDKEPEATRIANQLRRIREQINFALDEIAREERKARSSRPGQPERFDASSLDRKGFAAASSSPMLGKLLSEKQMPEGGWRAVETGGGALVISFEDGDVAGNFARRVASNGYSATAPVQSIGRYWNVEVKNG